MSAPGAASGDFAEVLISNTESQYVDTTQNNLPVGSSSLFVNIHGQNVTQAPGEFEIPIGNKERITVNIGGGGSGPKIKFSASLLNTQNNPDMYFRLRVKDELYFQDNPNANFTPMCETPNEAEKDFYVPMRATGNVYSPVSSIQATAPGAVAQVSADGYVSLDGVSPDRFYALFLKAPKFRGGMMIEHVQLTSGQNQPFDFSASPLEPGDLPDPNNSLKQDCTVNSVDLSLIVSSIGSTVPSDLQISDVNFDGIVNGNDVAKVVNTLSTKPDDDN
jgi:hypothetical protein